MSTNKIFLFFGIVFVLLTLSCKKTKLEGDMSILVGKWKWVYTITEDNGCVGYFGGPYLWADPSTAGYDYEMTILKRGKIVLKKGSRKKDYRLIYTPGVVFSTTDTAFAFELKPNHAGISLYYHTYSGTEYIVTPDLPEGTRDNCEYRLSYFEKVE